MLETFDKPEPEDVRAGTAFFILAGIFLPAAGLSLGEFLVPEWQSGRPSDYWAVAFSIDVGVYFVPALLFAAAGLLVARLEGARPGPFTELALLTGVLVSFQYGFLFAATRSEILGLGLLNFAPCVLFHHLRRKRVVRAMGFAVGWLLMPALGLLLAEGFDLSPDEAIEFIPGYLLFWVASLIAAAPLYALTAYGTLALRMPSAPRSRWTRLRWPPWVLGYGTAVWLAIQEVDETYRSLPTEPPNCYVCTASARGHRWLVRSWEARTCEGATFAVTRQMQVMKAAERVLRERAPRAHAVLRRGYDALGPKLARHLRTPLRADVAYLGLKPFEGIGWLLLILRSRP